MEREVSEGTAIATPVIGPLLVTMPLDVADLVHLVRRANGPNGGDRHADMNRHSLLAVLMICQSPAEPPVVFSHATGEQLGICGHISGIELAMEWVADAMLDHLACLAHPLGDTKPLGGLG